MPKIMASDAARWSGGRLMGPDRQLSRTWKNDSREIAPGDAFAALKGEKSDGHLHALGAVERGAKLLLMNASDPGIPALEAPEYADVTVIAVPETETALPRIASEYLKAAAPAVTAITGSVGKTTARELALTLLCKDKKVHGAIRSYNTLIGCSLTVLSMPEETEVLLLEFGTNHFGEIKELVSFFPPEIAVITEVAPAHLEGFGTVEGVLEAKTEICGSEKLKMLIYNSDCGLLENKLSYKFNNIEKIGVGKGSSSYLRIIGSDLRLGADGAELISEFSVGGRNLSFKTNLYGLQHSYNVAYAYLIAVHFGVSEDEIKERLLAFKPISGRGVCKKLPGNIWVIDEAYNANPSSMTAAIENTRRVSEHSGLSSYAVLGGMRELGDSSPFWHGEILKSAGFFKRLILLGEEWFYAGAELPDNAERYHAFSEITHLAGELMDPDSVILVKGSNSYGLKKFVALLAEGSHVY